MVSQLAPVVKNTDDIHFLSIGSAPAVLSTEVARNFQKNHAHVLREIDRLRSILPKSFVESNFGFEFRIVPTSNGGTRKVRQCALTRDALSLLIMGFTGKAAILWKLRYIEAFNAMEARLRDMAVLGGAEAPSREAIRESIYREGYDAGRAAVEPLLAEARGEAARLLWSLGPTQKRQLRRAARYHGMGLSQREISRLLTISRRSVQEMLKAARVLGWLDESAARPPVPALRQGSLLEEARHD